MLHEPAVGRGADVARARCCRLGAYALELRQESRVAPLGAALVGLPKAFVDLGRLGTQGLDGLAGIAASSSSVMAARAARASASSGASGAPRSAAKRPTPASSTWQSSLSRLPSRPSSATKSGATLPSS
jgi:hypothetical protein